MKLHNLQILITRPEANELLRTIRSLGGNPIHFPTIAFAPPPDQTTFQSAVRNLVTQDWLIFISPHAVFGILPFLPAHFPDSSKFAAVGPGTARILQNAGYTALFPEREHHSEALLSLPEFQEVSGKKIAIIRGKDGRELIDNVLAERGAIVSPVITYERILPRVDAKPVRKKIMEKSIDAIICTSGEGVRNLKILIGVDFWPYLQEIPLIVISNRIKRLAEDLGFRRIWVASHANTSALLDVIRKIT